VLIVPVMKLHFYLKMLFQWENTKETDRFTKKTYALAGG
jgi:hypothetical protein